MRLLDARSSGGLNRPFGVALGNGRPNGDDLTVRQLLHLTTVPDNQDVVDAAWLKRRPTRGRLARLVALIADTKPDFAAGSSWACPKTDS